MNTKTQGTQCSNLAYGGVEEYIDLFSKNNVSGIATKPDDVNRALLLTHSSLIEEFEQEKWEILLNSEKEKQSLKNAFENERKEYEMELGVLRNGTINILDDLEKKYETEINKRDLKMQANFEIEKAALRHSVQEQMTLIADVENEIKRILRRLIVELKKFKQSDCEKLQNDLLKTDFTLNSACLSWLTEIFNENAAFVSPKYDKNASCVCQKRDKDNHIQFEKDELHEVGEAFRKQKQELTDIFLKEKKHLQDEIQRGCQEHKKKLDKEYEERVQAETLVWQDTIQECEREIAILRYERQQMDRNYCLEIDKLKIETEKEKIDISTKYRKEREQLRRQLSDKVNDVMFIENRPSKKEVKGTHVVDEETKAGIQRGGN